MAVALLAIVLIAMYMTWTAGLQGWKAGSEAAEDLQKARAILDGVGALFRGAVYYDQSDEDEANENLYLFEGLEGTYGEMDADSVTFVTTSTAFLRPHEVEQTPLRRVRISLEQDEERRPYLALTSWSALALPDAEPPPPRKLSDEVIGFRVRYYDPDIEDWQRDWQDETGLPGQVEVTLTYRAADGDSEPLVQQQVFELPARGAAEDQVSRQRSAERRRPLRSSSR